jgi:hypothetical protein
MTSVTKEVFLASLECRGLAWMLLRSEAEPELSEADAFHRDQGREVGELARQAYLGGVFAPPGPTVSAAARTAAILHNASTSTVYEATFEADGLVAKADIVSRSGTGWHLVEVKSGVNDKAKLVRDLGYTTMVAWKAGVTVPRTSLVLVSAAYRKGVPVDRLFVEVDHSTGDFALLSNVSLACDGHQRYQQKSHASHIRHPTHLPPNRRTGWDGEARLISASVSGVARRKP